jgi:hypothetical protein
MGRARVSRSAIVQTAVRPWGTPRCVFPPLQLCLAFSVPGAGLSVTPARCCCHSSHRPRIRAGDVPRWGQRQRAGSLLSSHRPKHTWACVLCRPSPELPFRFVWFPRGQRGILRPIHLLPLARLVGFAVITRHGRIRRSQAPTWVGLASRSYCAWPRSPRVTALSTRSPPGLRSSRHSCGQ